MPIGAFALRFNNARLEKLTNRVMCLAGIALVLLFMRLAVGLLIPSHLMQEFHSQTDGFTAPGLTIGLPGLALMFGLIVPVCGYCGAKYNNRLAVGFFAWCNCLIGCLQVLLLILCILGLLAMGSVVERCKPGEAHRDVDLLHACNEIMQGCKYMKSSNFDLAKYEGCYDYMSSEMSPVMGFLGLCAALSCCVGCLAFASCCWGRELHSAMDYQELCIESSDDA